MLGRAVFYEITSFTVVLLEFYELRLHYLYCQVKNSIAVFKNYLSGAGKTNKYVRNVLMSQNI